MKRDGTGSTAEPLVPSGPLCDRILELRQHHLPTDRHQIRATILAVELADYIGLDWREREVVRWATRLHDQGKSRVPVPYLESTELTADQFLVIQQHPTTGAALLQGLVDDRICRLVRQHHEWLDGSGYPDGLFGDELDPLVSFVKVADCFDSMVSQRSYRPAMEPTQAINKILANAGTQFSAHLAEQFARMITTRLPRIPKCPHSRLQDDHTLER